MTKTLKKILKRVLKKYPCGIYTNPKNNRDEDGKFIDQAKADLLALVGEDKRYKFYILKDEDYETGKVDGYNQAKDEIRKRMEE